MDKGSEAETRVDQIRALIRELSKAERRLQALTEEEIDAVVDPESGTPTTLRRAYEQLRRSEVHLRLLGQLPAVVWATDTDMRVTSISGSGLSTVDLDSDEWIGEFMHDFAQTDDDISAALSAHRRALQGESVTYELKLAGRTYEYSVEPLRDEEGTISGCVGLALDISRRVEAEEALRRAHDQLEERVWERTVELSGAYEELKVTEEEIRQQNEELVAARRELETERRRYQELFAFAPDGYLITDPRGVIREANHAASAMLDVDGDSLIGKPLSLYVAEEDRSALFIQLAQVTSLARAARKVRFELRMQPRNGDGFHASVAAAPIYDGGDLASVRWSLRDVTEHVRIQQELERLLSQVNQERQRAEGLAETLKQERDTLQAIMESTHAHLAYLDTDFNFVRVNTAYAEGAGYSKEELIGRNHFELFPHAENQAIFKRVKETGEPAFFHAKPFEFPDRPELGTTYWDWSLVPTKDDDGGVQGLVFSLLNVTERERLMQQLETERAKLQAIIENAPEGIVVADEKARIILTNPAADRLYARPVPYGQGYESHGLLCICRGDGTAIPPRDLPLTRSALDGETHQDEELAIMWPDGERRDLLVDTAPIRDSRGEIGGAIGVLRDVTERKRIEERMRQYASRLRALHEMDRSILAARSAGEIADAALEHLQELVPSWRASVEIFDFEAMETSLLAFRGDEETRFEKGWRGPLRWSEALQGLKAGRLQIVEDIQAAPSSSLTETLEAEGVRSYVSVPLRAGGELIGALSLGMRIKGGPTADQIDVIRDVADQLAIGIRQAQLSEEIQRHAEELERRVTDRTAQLRTSEARFRAIFEQSAIGIALLDKKGRVIASNPALHKMLGHSSDDLIGRAFTDFAHPAEEVEADVEIFREIRDGERDYHRVETRYVGAGDEIHWANMVLSLVRGPAGEPRFVIAMVEDTTERKKAQAALIQSEKLATTGKLAASLAHEVNNPLQTVIGCLGLAEESLEAGGSDDELKQYIGMAHGELKRAARIVSRLRDLSQPMDDAVGEPTDVDELIDRVIVLTRKRLKDKQIEVIRHTAEDLPKPKLVPDRIQQVFLNLMLNAIDAVPRGEEIAISVSYDDQADEVHVAFTDCGAGVPADVLPHIFDPFFSTKDEGSGLGLFVSQNIVQEHGGRIEVESEVGNGCTFTVRLPA